MVFSFRKKTIKNLIINENRKKIVTGIFIGLGIFE